MKKYWFYGMLPKDAIGEDELTDSQKKIIEKEASALSKRNLFERWIGYQVKDGWEFMRHGFEVILIKEDKGNIARLRLIKILGKRFL